MGGAVGLMMFLQYWYWYPLMHMLSLAFAPTVLIGLNKDFNMPTNFNVICHAPPSMFAYPKVDEKKEDEKKMKRRLLLLLYCQLLSRLKHEKLKKKPKNMVCRTTI